MLPTGQFRGGESKKECLKGTEEKAADHGTPPRARTLTLAALGWHGGLGAGLCLGLAGPAVLASARAAGLVGGATERPGVCRV